MRPNRAAIAVAQAGVVPTGEFDRVFNLPRRVVTPESVDVDAWTAYLRNPDYVPTPRDPPMRLFFSQALALAELSRVRGLIVVEEAGSGKTMIGALAATILNSQAAMYFCPASAYSDLVEKSIPELQRQFRVSKNLTFWKYSQLSSQLSRNLLFQQMPDLIICDEAHLFKNENAARTNRFLEYLQAYPKTIVIPMTGTPSVRNLRECAHYYILALRGAAPIPLPSDERNLWGDALGSDLRMDAPQRPPVGALVRFAEFLSPEERAAIGDDELELARAGYGRRLAETPGVIQQEEIAVKIPLVVRFPRLNVSPRIREAFQHFRSEGMMPGGEIAVDAKEQARSARELIFGFYYRWVWPENKRNERWLEARRNWNKYVRNKVIYEKESKLDSRGLVENACKAWEMYRWAKREHRTDLAQAFIDQGIPMLDSPQYREWKAIEHEYTPVTKTEWIDGYMLDAIQEWLEKNHGVAWVEHTAIGMALRERGVIYYGGGDDDIWRETRSCAASIDAHYQSKNLQQWHRCLYPFPPSNGARWEQSLARFHRRKQLAECVYADVWESCAEARRAFAQAYEDARYASRITSKPQRLVRAQITGRLSDEEIGEMIAAGDSLWA